MFTEAQRLPESAVLDGFTPDPCEAWLAAYGGPCGDPECKKQHTRLFLMPIIGWLHVVQATEASDETVLRPAIMSSSGEVIDYLGVPAEFKFIAIVPRDENSIANAKEIYHKRFGEPMPLVEEPQSDAAAN